MATNNWLLASSFWQNAYPSALPVLGALLAGCWQNAYLLRLLLLEAFLASSQMLVSSRWPPSAHVNDKSF